MKRYIKSSKGTFDPLSGDTYFEYDELDKSAQDNAFKFYLDWLNQNGFDISNDDALEVFMSDTPTFYEDGSLFDDNIYPNPDDYYAAVEKAEYNKSNNILDIDGYDFIPTDGYVYENNNLYALNNFGERVYAVGKCVKKLSNYKIYSEYFDTQLPNNNFYIVNTTTGQVWQCRDIIMVNFHANRSLTADIADWLEKNNP